MTDAEQPAVRLPLLNKLLFSADHIGLQAISYFRQSWILFFLAPPVGEGMARVPDLTLLGFGIDPRVFAGFLLFAGRFIDAFTDPLIGWWSDRTRSRWGRRIPFILFSTPFYGLFAALVWFLPTEDASLWNALYFFIVLELFFTAGTMSSGALEALIPEVSRTPKDRMNLVGLIFAFAFVGAALGLIVVGKMVDTLGFQYVGIILAVVGVFFRYLSLSAVWRHAPRHTPPAQVPFWRGVKDTLRNSQFVSYLPTYVMFTTGVGMLQGWIPFFASIIIGADQEGSAASNLFIAVFIGVFVAAVSIWLAFDYLQISKRRIYGLCLIGSGAAFPLLALVGLVSPNGLMLQSLVLLCVAGLPMAAVFLLPKAITADVADYDELMTGERREALFYSTQNFFEKITFALPPLFLSLTLLLGDTADNPLGIRLVPVFAGVLAIAGFTLWPRYRLPDTINRETVTQAGLLPARA